MTPLSPLPFRQWANLFYNVNINLPIVMNQLQSVCVTFNLVVNFHSYIVMFSKNELIRAQIKTGQTKRVPWPIVSTPGTAADTAHTTVHRSQSSTPRPAVSWPRAGEMTRPSARSLMGSTCPNTTQLHLLRNIHNV